MPYTVQVRIKVSDNPLVYEWRDVRPTGGQPYTYATQAEASAMMRMCYPDQTRDEVRVKEQP